MSLLGTFSFYFGETGSGETFVPRTASGGMPVGRMYICHGGERIDQVAFAAYGIQAGAVEALLIKNPGLADLPITLPAYLAIELPELTIQKRNRSREVPLWS